MSIAAFLLSKSTSILYSSLYRTLPGERIVHQASQMGIPSLLKVKFETPQSCCPMKFTSQYRHETKLETCYRNTVIVIIKTAAPLVLNKIFPPYGTVFSQYLLHQSSIRWLESDFLKMKLSSPAQSSSPSRLINLTYPFLVPQSALITLAVPPSCWTRLKKYLEITVGSLSVYPTSSHKIRLLHPSMASWIRKPTSFNLP